MLSAPYYIPLLFLITTAISVIWFWQAANKNTKILYLILVWCILQSAVALSGFYTYTNSLPPRFVLLVGPALLTIGLLFAFHKSRTWLDSLNLQKLTLLHSVRFPVELVLYWLSLEHLVPELMTFEGLNFDILSGLTATPILYAVFQRKLLGPKFLLFWNCICLMLLLCIIYLAVFSAPTPFQKYGFEQPNIAVFYFPYILLPGCVVPLVLLSHLAAIRQLGTGRFHSTT